MIPGAASQVVFAQQPDAATAGSALSPAVTAKLEDVFGNVETGDNASILSIVMASGPISAAFASGSTTTATVNAGVAAFNNLKLNTAGNYTLQASDGALNLTSAASSTFTITPAAASLSQSIVSAAAPTLLPGATTTVTLTTVDAYGNLEPAGLPIAFGVGSGSASGTFSSVTYSTGGLYTATFTATTAGGNTFTAAINGQAVTFDGAHLHCLGWSWRHDRHGQADLHLAPGDRCVRL